MQDGDRYVVASQNTLYRVANSSCSEGSQITLTNSTVERVYLINGTWTVADTYTTSNYGSTTYMCHVWSNATQTFNINYLVLPAVILVVAFFSLIYKWFIRLRG